MNNKNLREHKESKAREVEPDENKLDGGVTAKPHDASSIDASVTDVNNVASVIDYGEMNLEDAKASGYTDAKGHAVERAKKDVEGSPTGALTDIGAGRSSAVYRPKDHQTH